MSTPPFQVGDKVRYRCKGGCPVPYLRDGTIHTIGEIRSFENYPEPGQAFHQFRIMGRQYRGAEAGWFTVGSKFHLVWSARGKATA